MLGGYTYTRPYIEDTKYEYDSYTTETIEFNPDQGAMDTVQIRTHILPYNQLKYFWNIKVPLQTLGQTLIQTK